MRNVNLTWTVLFVALLTASGCAVGGANKIGNFEPTGVSRRAATALGKGNEYLTAMEALGSEAERKSRWEEAARIYMQASGAAVNLAQFQKAISHAHKAVELAERQKNLSVRANAMLYLATAYGRVGQVKKKTEWLEKARATFKLMAGGPGTDITEPRLYQQLGSNYLSQGETNQGIQYLLEAANLWEARLNFLNSPAGNQTRKLRQGVQYTELMFENCLNLLGNAYLQAGNLREAIEAYEQGIAVAIGSNLRTEYEIRLRLGLGRAYLAQKDLPRAMEYLSEALQVSEARRETWIVSEASGAIGDVYLQSKKPLEAIPHYKQALAGIESSRLELGSEEFRASFFENKVVTYSGMIQAQLALKNFDEAFNYNERSRSRALLDVLGSKVQLAHSGTLLEQERELQARISVLRAMAEAREEDAAETTDLRRKLAEAEQAYNDYLSQVRKENKEQASLMSVEPLTLKEVQERLDPETTMLEYFVSGDNVWLWVVEKDRVEFVSTTVARKDLVTKVTELRDTIYQFGEKDRFSALSQELYNLLIQLALPHIKGKELIIVPHDVLHYLPFQALLDPDGHYLIEKYPLYYLSSASLLKFTTEKRKALGSLTTTLSQLGKVLALGNPDLGDPKMNLQYAESEAQEIQKLYPQATVLLEKEATKAKAEEISPTDDIVHFATHAQLNENDPLSSAILLAKGGKEDGRLEAREIFGMNLKANLVVLSGCETALGKLSTGDELVGLTRAFIYAGTPSVVASLWNVDDGSTAVLMASFYKNLKTMSKAEALRQAQLELIRGQGRSDLLAKRGVGGIGKLGETPASQSSSENTVSTSDPYFWAPFILVGDGK